MDEHAEPAPVEPERPAQAGPVGPDVAPSLGGLVRRRPDGSLAGAATPKDNVQLLLALQRSAGNASVNRLLRQVAPPAEADPASAPAAVRIVADEGPEPTAAQMRRGDFLDALEPEVCRTAEETLTSPMFRVAGCPWIGHWIAYYREKSPDEIEHAIARYAPAAARATSARELITAVCTRVGAGIADWEATGEMPTPPPGGPPVPATAGAAAPVAFKLRDGASAERAEPRDIERRLGAGDELEPAVRGRMSRALGADLSRVRVHTDAAAGELTGSLRARAFAVGPHIAFAPNRYEPGTPLGDGLIAHELAHVIQQGAATPTAVARAARSTSLEADADAAAIEAVIELHGEGEHTPGAAAPALRAGARVQRCGDDPVVPIPQAPARSAAEAALDQPALGQGPAPAPAPEEIPPMTAAEINTRLELMERLLGRVAARYPADQAIQLALGRARAGVGRVRGAAGSTPDAPRRVHLAAQVLERCETLIPQLDATRTTMASQPTAQGVGGYERAQRSSLEQVDGVRAAYVRALGSALDDDAAAVANTADQAAAALPRALTDIELTRMEHGGPPYHAEQQADHYAWIQWTRAKLDELNADAQTVATARRQRAPDLADREQRFRRKVELVQLSLQGLEHYDRILMATAQLQNHNVIPGVARDVWRIMARCKAMHDAATAADIEDLRARIARHVSDPDVEAFYRAVPLFRFAGDFAIRFGIVLAAAMVTAGIGGLVTGAVEGTAIEGTLLAGAGRVAVEALAFTVTQRGLSSAAGQQVQGSFLNDLAWNFGLFSILAGTARVARGMTAAASVPALAGTATMVMSAPLLHAYGLLRFRAESGHWASQAEIDMMVVDEVLMMLGLSSAMGLLPRGGGRGTSPAIERFADVYGPRFQAVELVRRQLVTDFTELMARGQADPAAPEVQALRTRAQQLEATVQRILDEAKADAAIDIPAIRAELGRLGTGALQGAGRLVSADLGVPEAVAVRRAGGEREFSYHWGKTTDLTNSLRGIGARTETSPPDPATGQKTVTAHLPGEDAPLTFLERPSPYPAAREVAFDPADPAIVRLQTDMSITSPRALRELQRMITTELAQNPAGGVANAVRAARRYLTTETARAGNARSADQVLEERATRGARTMQAPPRLTAAADGLAVNGILATEEWLSCRDDGEYVGVVGETLATGEAVAGATSGQTVLRNVEIVGDLFDDAALTVPHVTGRHGRPAVGIDVVPELDLLTGEMVGTTLQFSNVANVKAVQQRGSARVQTQAATQNTEALGALRAHSTGQPFQRADGVWARITQVRGVDARTNAAVNLTGRVQPSATVTTETIGPAAGRGDVTAWNRRLAYTYDEIVDIARLLRERQAMNTPGY